jgi:hypothetical protein
VDVRAAELLPPLAAVNAPVLRAEHHEAVGDVGVEPLLFPRRELAEIAVPAPVEEDERELPARGVPRLPEIGGDLQPVAEIGEALALEPLVGPPALEFLPRRQQGAEGRERLHGDPHPRRLRDLAAVAAFVPPEPALVADVVRRAGRVLEEGAVELRQGRGGEGEDEEGGEEEGVADHGVKNPSTSLPARTSPF